MRQPFRNSRFIPSTICPGQLSASYCNIPVMKISLRRTDPLSSPSPYCLCNLAFMPSLMKIYISDHPHRILYSTAANHKVSSELISSYYVRRGTSPRDVDPKKFIISSHDIEPVLSNGITEPLTGRQNKVSPIPNPKSFVSRIRDEFMGSLRSLPPKFGHQKADSQNHKTYLRQNGHCIFHAVEHHNLLL